ncbi:MAG: glycosyltransferase family 39 protein [Planctomycetes bacterium]|nr:glycosyltransferase family 39 protein [Planctomycetota bacterium]
MKPARLAALIVLFLLPLCVRLWPIEHGLPRNYIPDSSIARAALSMARDHDFAPPSGRYTQYPNLLPYLLLPVYAAEYEAGKLRGDWKNSKEFGAHVLENPEDAQLPARLLVALLGALTPFVVFKIARAAGMGHGAWIAAWLVGTGLLHTHFSVQERPWVPMTFFMALSAWPAVLYARDGRTRQLVLAGLASALAFAVHQGGLGALGIAALAWGFAPGGWKGAALGRRIGAGVLCVGAFALLALFAGYAQYLVHPDHPTEKVILGAEVAQQGGIHIGAMSLVFHVRWESLVRLSRALFGYDPLLVALGLLGFLQAWKRRELRAPMIFLVAWAAFFMTNQSDHVRYLLPVAVLLALPAGLAAESFLTTRMSMAAVCVLLCFPLVEVLRLDVLLRREDTRAECERRLESLPSGEVVAIAPYGPEVELDRASLYRLQTLRNSQREELRSREAHRLERFERGELDERAGVDAVRAEELFLVDERAGTVKVREGLEPLGSDPASVLRALHATHYLRVQRRVDSSEPLLLDRLVAGRKPLWVIDPASGPAGTREAFLPTEMEFPLSALWSVARPGPRLEFYALE